MYNQEDVPKVLKVKVLSALMLGYAVYFRSKASK